MPAEDWSAFNRRLGRNVDALPNGPMHDLVADPNLPADTTFWAAFREVSGGTRGPRARLGGNHRSVRVT